MAKYDESHSQQNISYVELGRISGILLREEFRNHLEINSGQVYELIGDFSESEFWKAYENCSSYELVNDAILGSDRYVKTFGDDQMDRFKKIQNTFQSSTADASDKRLKEAVNKTFYTTKKRMFQHMFRKPPDSHQNIAVLHRILDIWPLFATYLHMDFDAAKLPADILESLARTWRLNALSFPKFGKLQKDWQLWETQEKKISFDQDRLFLWNVDEYKRDIYGYHRLRDIILQ
jgi:hypothetical protein